MKLSKGDVVIIPVPFTDNVRHKMRPAVVISNDVVHSTGDVLIVQITSMQKHDGLSMELTPDDLTINLPIKSYIRFHKIFILEKKLIKVVVSKLSKTAYGMLVQNIVSTIK